MQDIGKNENKKLMLLKLKGFRTELISFAPDVVLDILIDITDLSGLWVSADTQSKRIKVANADETAAYDILCDKEYPLFQKVTNIDGYSFPTKDTDDELREELGITRS